MLKRIVLTMGGAVALAMPHASSAQGECDLAWSPLGDGIGGGVLGSAVFALTTFDDRAGPALYAGGHFTTAGPIGVSHIARWDGAEWSSVSSGVWGGGWLTVVTALEVFDDRSGAEPALYVGGRFEWGDTVALSNIGRWDGEQWTPLGSGIPQGFEYSSIVSALAAFDDGTGPALYVGGAFRGPGSNIARWDGSGWSPVGAGMDGPVGSLVVFDDGSGAGPALYAAGDFTTADGVTVNNIARWDGDRWSALGAGANDTVRSLAVFNDGAGAALYAAGDFTAAGGGATNYVARWDGHAWSPLGSGMSGGSSRTVYALAVFDDGAGPALYAAGNFRSAGGVPAAGIARWDGAAWSPLGAGIGGYPYALTVFDDGAGVGPALYAGGSFSTAGRAPASDIARWGCAPCYPDCDGSGDLTFFDFLCFQNLFAALDPGADCDGDAEFTFFDFLCFQNAFAAGCP
jgi:hypothetical protein